MRRHLIPGGLALCLTVVLGVGCQPSDKSTKPAAGTTKEPAVVKKGKHDAWWCKEHGIPEAECLACLHSEADLKKMGDWCDLHDTAKSQCFKCDPKLKELYAAKYRTKYGKEPPPIEDDEPTPKKEPEKKPDGDKKDKK